MMNIVNGSVIAAMLKCVAQRERSGFCSAPQAMSAFVDWLSGDGVLL